MRSATASAARRRKVRRSPSLKPPKLIVAALTDVDEVIDSWVPHRGPAVGCWSSIGPEVRAIVSAARPGGPELAVKFMRVVARHVAIRFQAGHAVSDWVKLFADAALTSTFRKDGPAGLSEASMATELAYARQIRAKVCPAEYGALSELRHSAHAVAAPYTDREVSDLLAWCRTAPSSHARVVTAALLLGLACGLDGYEADKVTGGDLLVSPWGLLVRAPGMGQHKSRPPRLVPVLGRFEADLAEAFRPVSVGEPILGRAGVNKSAQALYRAQPRTANLPTVTGRQARAWWTVTTVVAGAPFLALRQAGVSLAGDKALASLTNGLTMPFDSFVTSMRQGNEPFDAALFGFLPVWDPGS